MNTGAHTGGKRSPDVFALSSSPGGDPVALRVSAVSPVGGRVAAESERRPVISSSLGVSRFRPESS
jgi:hypothetical protein